MFYQKKKSVHSGIEVKKNNVFIGQRLKQVRENKSKVLPLSELETFFV